MQLPEIIAWISIALVAHSYFLYPVIIFVAARFYKEPDEKLPDELPEISIIIAAYNEETSIQKKIDNTLSLDYPMDKIEILIGSDGSTDKTNEILDSIDNERIKTFMFPGRNGKNYVLNQLVPQAKGRFLVFTDVRAICKKDSIKELIKRYTSDEIGAVCGQWVIINSEEISGKSSEQAYWSFEVLLRKCEARIKTSFGTSGALYSIKRELFKPLPMARPIVDDFIIPIFIIMQGFRVIYSETAIVHATDVDNIFIEFSRRIRIGSHNINGIKYFKSLLWPHKGFIAFGLWSHKILRWLTPILLILHVIGLVFLLDQDIYRYMLLVEAVLIAIALVGILLNRLNIKIKFVNFISYAFLLNLGLLIGLLKSVTGRQKAYWESTPRPK